MLLRRMVGGYILSLALDKAIDRTLMIDKIIATSYFLQKISIYLWLVYWTFDHISCIIRSYFLIYSRISFMVAEGVSGLK